MRYDKLLIILLVLSGQAGVWAQINRPRQTPAPTPSPPPATRSVAPESPKEANASLSASTGDVTVGITDVTGNASSPGVIVNLGLTNTGTNDLTFSVRGADIIAVDAEGNSLRAKTVYNTNLVSGIYTKNQLNLYDARPGTKSLAVIKFVCLLYNPLTHKRETATVEFKNVAVGQH